MQGIAIAGLSACWTAWLTVFLIKLARTPKRKSDITVRSGAWGFLLQCLAYFPVWTPVPHERPVGVLAIGLVLAAVGVVTTWLAMPALGKQWRLQPGLYPDHELVRRGPYRIVRHPIYASMLAMFLANALILSTWQLAFPALAVFIAGTEIRVRAEDKLLASRFGGQFRDYRASTPAYVPFLR
jgi:protein-S-isoprenylcysteine O-methyltransferase Ste14